MRSKFNALVRQGFARSVTLLVGGTALAQALTLLLLPLVTRLYTPHDFSLLAVFVSMLSTCTVVACLRLELAIPLPKGDDDAANVLALAVCICAGVTALVGIAVWLFRDQIVDILDQPDLAVYLWMLPPGVLLIGTYVALQFWAMRKSRFGSIATTRILQSIGSAGTQVGLGFAGYAPFGLLLGHLVNSGAGLIAFGRTALREDVAAFGSVRWRDMRRMFHEYDRFPKYSTFEAIASNAGLQFPIIIIAAVASGPEAGYLMLATRAIAGPMGLIGGAISQVYLSRAPSEHRAGNLANFTLQIVGGLARVGVGPLIFVGIVSPIAFPFIFGDEWRRAGDIVAWMTPWFVMQLIVSPVSVTLHVTGRQVAAMTLHFFGLILRIGAVIFAILLNAAYIVEAYAISGFIFYLVHFFIIMAYLKIKPKDMIGLLQLPTVIVLYWAIFGLIAKLAFSAIS